MQTGFAHGAHGAHGFGHVTQGLAHGLHDMQEPHLSFGMQGFGGHFTQLVQLFLPQALHGCFAHGPQDLPGLHEVDNAAKASALKATATRTAKTIIPSFFIQHLRLKMRSRGFNPGYDKHNTYSTQSSAFGLSCMQAV